jgi:hypothetical protein
MVRCVVTWKAAAGVAAARPNRPVINSELDASATDIRHTRRVPRCRVLRPLTNAPTTAFLAEPAAALHAWPLLTRSRISGSHSVIAKGLAGLL